MSAVEVPPSAAALQYPHPQPPEPGAPLAVADGVHWLRVPLPFQLDHINLWMLADEIDGEPCWTLVDTGIGNDATRALWDRIFEGPLGARPVRRVFLTHYHPDHAGNAEWMCRRFGAELWTTQGEYLTAHAMRTGTAGYSPDMLLEVFHRNGLDEARRAKMSLRGHRYAGLVPDFPHTFRRVLDGDDIAIGGRRWRVIVGYGHAPEHASLYCEGLGVLISGDMLLSTISTNVSVWSIEPDGDPLKFFLDSVRVYRKLPADTLVLPSHGRPFRGAHLRVDQLEAHHTARFAEVLAACAGEAKSAADILPVLFPRAQDAHQMFFAMGEAIAHLHALYYAGRLTRAVGSDGVVRYSTPVT